MNYVCIYLFICLFVYLFIYLFIYYFLALTIELKRKLDCLKGAAEPKRYVFGFNLLLELMRFKDSLLS